MRRIVVLAAAVLTLLAAAPPAAAATQTYRYSVLGSGAWASAVVYRDGQFEAAWVEIGDQARTASDGQTYFRYILFEHLLETCDQRGCTTIYTAGIAEDVPFTIDRQKLLDATVDVVVLADRCIDDGRRFECDQVEVPVRVDWDGYGAVIRSHGTATGGIAGVYQYTLNGAATERWATVSGSIAGFDLGAAGAIGALYKTRLAERTITHG